MDDEKILDLFFERSEEAIEAAGQKYGALAVKIATNILGDRSDAEECVNDSYLALWNAIPPARPGHLASFLCKIVRNLSLKRYQYNTAQKRNSVYDVALEEIAEFLPSQNTVEQEIEAGELTVMLEEFMDSLSQENRVIFMRRYWFADPYEDIADRVGMTVKNVSVRLVRMRKSLRGYLAERGVTV